MIPASRAGPAMDATRDLLHGPAPGEPRPDGTRQGCDGCSGDEPGGGTDWDPGDRGPHRCPAGRGKREGRCHCLRWHAPFRRGRALPHLPRCRFPLRKQRRGDRLHPRGGRGGAPRRRDGGEAAPGAGHLRPFRGAGSRRGRGGDTDPHRLCGQFRAGREPAFRPGRAHGGGAATGAVRCRDRRDAPSPEGGRPLRHGGGARPCRGAWARHHAGGSGHRERPRRPYRPAPHRRHRSLPSSPSVPRAHSRSFRSGSPAAILPSPPRHRPLPGRGPPSPDRIRPP